MAKGTSGMGGWAFIIGVIVAVLVGLFGDLSSSLWLGVLVVLGLIVGFLNVSGAESKDFLMATVSLVVVSYFGGQVLNVVPKLGPVLGAIMALVVPATIIVALKSVFSLARD